MPFRRLRGPEVWAQQPQVDWGNPINRGLVLFYPLSETGGFVARQIGANINSNGTLTNYTARAVSAGPAQTGPALGSSGTQYVAGPTSVPLGTNVVSFSLWLFFVSQPGFAALISKNAGDNNSSNWDWGLLMQGGGSAGLYLIRNGGNNTVAGAVTTNGWTHIGGVVSDTESLLYFNGVSVTVQGGVGSGATNNTAGRAVTLMGTAGGSGSVVTGRMSNARVFNRKLTQAEFSLLYARPMTGLLAPRRRIISQVPSVATFRPQIIRPQTPF